MLILETIQHETIWGGEKLTPYSNSDCKKIGHLYSLVSNGNFETEILNGKYKGQLFKKYFDENKTNFGLEKYEKFPFVIALVDASEDLSLQVHPDDKTAKKLENSNFGKNESWYFIDAPKSGKIYNGCKIKNKFEFEEKINQKKYDDIIDFLDVKKDDYVFVEAGTLHSMSAGSLVYEIEENCDITYRFYDFERVDKNGQKRALHTNKVLKSVNVNLKSKAETFDKEKKERFYSIKLQKNKNKYKNESVSIECLTIINGNFIIDDVKVQRGTTLVIEPNEEIHFSNSDFIIARPI